MNKTIIQKIKNSIRYEESREDEDSLSLEIDRYRRHDHGGGDDGDDWLDDHEIDMDFQQGVKEHGHKLAKVKAILEEDGYLPLAEFELGEKGHFSIEITFKKPKK